jgi:hypothetical protein
LVKHAAPLANFVETLLSGLNSANATIAQPFFSNKAEAAALAFDRINKNRN